jgi:hypothetical protein
MKRPSARSREAVERLRARILARKDFAPHLPDTEPDWVNWTRKAGLAADQAEALQNGLRLAWLLPFADFKGIADLLLFRHARLATMRQEFTQAGNARALQLCALFELFTDLALQGNSLCPQNAVHLARQAQLAIESPPTGRDQLGALLDLLVDATSLNPRVGNNTAEVSDLETVILSEHERREGLAEQAWKAGHKFTEYERALVENPEFHADWQAVKRHFKVARWRDSRGIIRRSRLPERNWQRPTHPDLSVTAERFQVVFDFFCWKWFLYGMRDDDPLLEKLTYTLTPYGTQIFIPGYWNFDPARDINWKSVTRLHRARGLEKQGEKLAANRRERDMQLGRLKAADAEARRLRLRGKERFDYLKTKAGLAAAMDDAQVRRMVQQASHANE